MCVHPKDAAYLTETYHNTSRSMPITVADFEREERGDREKIIGGLVSGTCDREPASLLELLASVN